MSEGTLGSGAHQCPCIRAGLYKGVTLSAAGVVPYLAVSFAVYDELKAMLPGSKAARLEWWYPVAKIGIGAIAAVVAQACLPLHQSRLVTSQATVRLPMWGSTCRPCSLVDAFLHAQPQAVRHILRRSSSSWEPLQDEKQQAQKGHVA